MVWWLLAAVFALALVLTGLLRKYALSRGLMDVPNARSSHDVPTPRGGGVAIVLSFLAVLPFLGASNGLSSSYLISLSGAGALIALIGFLDDHGHIAARWRLLGHFIAAAWALYWIGGMSPVEAFGFVLDLGWFGHILAATYLVWMLNLYNFMDGIDGLASVEAICVCVGGCIVYFLGGHGFSVTPLILALAVCGFLYWNFPPARIFMGDAGSGFLGITLGILSLQAAWVSPDLFWAWLILLGVFVVDATFTLVRRLLRGDKVYEAHRSHAYQFASRHYGAHKPVTVGVVLINLFWLLPLAVCLVKFKLDGILMLLVAYVPLFLLALKFGAGSLEEKK